jgi:UPF0716 protein FxsA
MNGVEANEGTQRGPDRLLTIVAGLLLAVPGFLTDLLGAALLVGPVHSLCGSAVRRWFTGRRRPGDPSTIDLAPDEWKQVSNRKISNRPKPHRE